MLRGKSFPAFVYLTRLARRLPFTLEHVSARAWHCFFALRFMFRFIHSADWQLGKNFKGFGVHAEGLRAQRLATLRRALNLARERAADAFFVAGDLFEDPLVEDALVEETLRTFADFSEIPVRIISGNHDPAGTPGSIWNRHQFLDGALPPNVAVCREPGVHSLGSVALLVSPLRQKISSTDPSLCLRGLSQAQPADRIKIGLTHGALAIPGKHQPNDFPIDPAAATRAGLDYLGVGHWHGWSVYDADGRLVMPGTPEQDAFDHGESGFVAYVEIDGPTAPPRVEKVRVSGLRWSHWDCDFNNLEAHRVTLQGHVNAWDGSAARNVCRVCLTGHASLAARTEALAWLEALFGGTFYFKVDDQTRPVLSPGELAALEREHPILGQVVADLNQLELLATGAVPPGLATGGAREAAIPLAEAQALASAARLDLAALDAQDFLAARELLFAGVQAAAANVCP